jgi:hypothetical protein
MMTILVAILLAIYTIGFIGLFTFIWALGGFHGWRAIQDAIIVGVAWPYVLWNWFK